MYGFHIAFLALNLDRKRKRARRKPQAPRSAGRRSPRPPPPRPPQVRTRNTGANSSCLSWGTSVHKAQCQARTATLPPSNASSWRQLRETKNSDLNIPTDFGVNVCARHTVPGGSPPTASTAANYFLFHYFEKPAGQFGD